MKSLLTILGLFTIVSLYSQTEEEFNTLLGGKSHGGYGAMSVGYSPINKTDALVYGARGGVYLENWLALGLGGNGFVTAYNTDHVLGKKTSLMGGYGGAFIEFIVPSRSFVHVSVPLFAGVGAGIYSSWLNQGEDYIRENKVEEVASFMVFEPSVEIEFNLFKICRAALYASYRYTTDLDIKENNAAGETVRLVDPQTLNSYSAGVIFKFGKF